MGRIRLLWILMALPISNLNLDDFDTKPVQSDIWSRSPFASGDDLGAFKKPKLLMIVYGPQKSAALLNTQHVQKGDHVGNYEVTSIRPGEVILRGPDGLLHLKLDAQGTRGLRRAESYQIQAKEAPLGEAVKLLAMLQNKNVVMPSKLEENVTASFPRVSLAEGMQALLESRGYSAFEKGDVIRIMTLKDQEALGADLVTRVLTLKYAKAKDIKEQALQLLSPRGKVMVDERTNAVTVMDTPGCVKNIETFIDNIDNVDRQVLIEARVVEASDEFIEQLGIQWGVKVDTSNFKMDGIRNTVQTTAATNTVTGAAASVPAPTGPEYMNFTRAKNPLFGLAVGIPFSNNQLDFELSAAESENKATILSRPSIVTMNNQPATIHSGQKIYISVPGSVGISASGTLGSNNSLQAVTAGITMVATPQITVDGKIRLSVDVTSSSFINTGASNQNIQVNDNNAKTQILLYDGETTVLGGLYQSDNKNGRGGVPFWSRIPFLGALFRNSSVQKTKRELLVFIKPTIVKTAVKEINRIKEEAVSPFEGIQRKP